MDLHSYLTTNDLDTFAETLSIRYHHVNVIVVVVGLVVAGVIPCGTDMGLCFAIFMVVPGFKSIKGLCWVFAPS